MKHPHLSTLLKAANEVYGDGDLRLDQNLPLRERGDMLADYLAVEIDEVSEDSEPDFESARRDVINSLESAVCRLEDVINALKDCQSE